MIIFACVNHTHFYVSKWEKQLEKSFQKLILYLHFASVLEEQKYLNQTKKVGCDELSFQFPVFQAIAEDAMVGWLMSNRVNASFVHLKVGGMPALLPIPLYSLQMGLSNPWFRQLSRWDTSWKNLLNQKDTSFIISQHYIKPEEMFILYNQQK